MPASAKTGEPILITMKLHECPPARETFYRFTAGDQYGPNSAQTAERARDLGVPFAGHTGPLNAITDVAGVEVGDTTLISGSGKLVRGTGPVRTGVTAILPRGKNDATPVLAGYFAQNGNGEMTGTAWVKESGFAEGPILITNTHSVGVARDAVIKWQVAKRAQSQLFNDLWSLPICC